MESASAQATSTRQPNHTPHWIIAVLLALILGALWGTTQRPLLPAALAQSPTLAGARGVYAFTGQLEHNRYGLFMLDIDEGTLWCYEIESGAGVRKLRLIAARSWIYDRYLRDFNCAGLDPQQVADLVAQQRAAQTPGAPAPMPPDTEPPVRPQPERSD